MSFDQLQASDYTTRKEEILIKVGDKELKFSANEISYLQRLNIATLQNSGGDAYSQLVVYSIKDQDGRHMTLDQAQRLAPEHAQALFVAAAKVNNQEKKD